MKKLLLCLSAVMLLAACSDKNIGTVRDEVKNIASESYIFTEGKSEGKFLRQEDKHIFVTEDSAFTFTVNEPYVDGNMLIYDISLTNNTGFDVEAELTPWWDTLRINDVGYPLREVFLSAEDSESDTVRLNAGESLASSIEFDLNRKPYNTDSIVWFNEGDNDLMLRFSATLKVNMPNDENVTTYKFTTGQLYSTVTQ